MPKIRDLGINVIPETMRPPQIGGGAGGGCEGASVECAEGTACPSGTFQGTAGCKDYAECPSGTFQGTAGCKDYAECTSGTFVTTTGCKDYECTPGTFVTTTACYGAQCPSGTYQQCTPGTYGPQCPGGTVPCTPGTMINCHAESWATPHLTRLAAEQTGKPEAAAFTREAIELLKQQLQQQIAKLEEIAKNLTNDEK